MRIQGNRGFTVLDIIAGLALSGLLVSIAAPSASSLLERYQVRGATSQVSFELVRARMQAIAQNRSIRISFGEGGGYVVERTNDQGVFDSVVAAATMPEGVVISAEFSSVTFDREGVASEPISITIGKDELHRTISMNSIGRMTES